MPHCHKCGAEIAEGTKFCSNCGTPVLPKGEPEERLERKTRMPVGILVIALIVLVVVSLIIVALTFIPVRTLNVNRRHSIPYQVGVDTLNLTVAADVADIKIIFENLTGEWQSPSIILNASATARAGTLVSPDILDKFFRSNNTTVGNVLVVTAQIDIPWSGWPMYSLLNVTCEVMIDPSMNTSLNIKTGVGRIVMDTQAGVVLDSLSLKADTGGVEANMAEDLVIAGDVFVKATTGDVKLHWNDVITEEQILVEVETTTGSVELEVKQDEELAGNVTVVAKTTTGGVDFVLDIKGDIGAEIESHTSLGDVDIERDVGFSGDQSCLYSDNYPAGSNYFVNLRTTVGGINIDAKHTPHASEYL